MRVTKKILLPAVLSLFCLFLLKGFLASQQTAGELFEKALYTEEAQGDLKKAIDLYQQIVNRFPEDREIAAKAQLHIGLCYEKLGLEEAQKAFQKVVEEYPDQKETVRVAREKLSVLLKAKAALTESEPSFTIRKIKTGIADGLGEVSPDGNFISLVDWNTGNLAIQELATGKKRNLTDKGTWAQSEAMAFQSRWSPDGKHIVFDWWDWDEPPFVGIRMIDVDGSNLQDLYRVNPEKEVTIVYGWSPDGKDILASVWDESNSAKIVLISVADHTTRVLKVLDLKRIRWNKINGMSFSPCGKYIAYDFPAQDSPNRDIYVLSRDGKSEIPLFEHPANDTLLGWTSDGKNILFVSDRRGTLDIWLVPVDEGKASGAPELIREGAGEIASQGFLKDGSFYYVTSKSAENVYVARIDPKTGKVTESPNLTITHLGTSTHSPAYSHDGKHLAYVSIRGPAGNASHVICIRSIETGKDRELYPELLFYDLQWSPDDRFLIAIASDKRDRTGHHVLGKIDVITGEVTPIYRCEKPRHEWNIRTPVWSQDGKSVFYVLNDEKNKICRLLVRDIDTGQVKELYKAPSWAERINISRSPDGQWLSMINRAGEQTKRVISILSTSGGDPRELYSMEFMAGWQINTAWTSDGKHILFPVSSPDNDTPGVGTKADLWRIPVEGGEPQQMGITMFRFYNLSMHPSGKYLAFGSLGPKVVEPELWVMENFLAKK